MKYIKLTQGKFAIVDDEDFEKVSQFNWFYHKGYAKRGIWNPKTKNNNHQTMHNFLIGNIGSVDHKNRNGLDNQKINLRKCNQTMNLGNREMKRNKAGFKGVKLLSNCNKYQARIGFNNQDVYLGNFNTPQEAANAYNQAAIKYFGEFARLNKI